MSANIGNSLEWTMCSLTFYRWNPKNIQLESESALLYSNNLIFSLHLAQIILSNLS